ncbi:MAG: ArsA family ATPase [Myxococcota bacterium]
MIALLDRRLIVVAGKGGVGRTTVAAALALAAARRGRRVLLAQTRAKDPAHHLLGGPPVGEEVVQTAPNLWCVNMTPRAALRQYGLMVLRFEAVYRAVFENRVVRPFLRAVPGLDEYSMLGKVWFHTTEEEGGAARFDTVILDGPATGHLLAMLRLPKVIVDTVPPGPLARDAARILELLRDPLLTVAHLVTLAEEMPIAETEDLMRGLQGELGVPLGALVVNAVSPDHFPKGGPADLLLDRLLQLDHTPLDATLGDVARRAHLSRARRRMHERYLSRIQAEVPLPSIELPALFVPRVGPPEIEELSRRLAG